MNKNIQYQKQQKLTIIEYYTQFILFLVSNLNKKRKSLKLNKLIYNLCKFNH